MGAHHESGQEVSCQSCRSFQIDLNLRPCLTDSLQLLLLLALPAGSVYAMDSCFLPNHLCTVMAAIHVLVALGCGFSLCV